MLQASVQIMASTPTPTPLTVIRPSSPLAWAEPEAFNEAQLETTPLFGFSACCTIQPDEVPLRAKAAYLHPNRKLEITVFNRYSTVYSLYTTAAAQKHFRRLLPHPQLFASVWALPRQKPMQKLPQLRLPNWLLQVKYTSPMHFEVSQSNFAPR